ncbi:tetratricopeptide repeat protein, partial [Enterococcus faecalis]|uniref:tetratricopeptide repeat protein n=1 Tax=Enterococcus faecalis TaxID=1351 RepID=UPI003D6B6555
AVYYSASGMLEDCEPLLLRAVSIREINGAGRSLEVANLLKGMARNYRKMGRYGDADDYYLRALAIKEEILGPNHEDVAESMRSL